MSSDGNDAARTEAPGAGKDQMMAFLTRTGKVRPGLASSLIDQGLDDPAKLRSMERGDLLKYKGVGERTADILLELKEIAKEEAPEGSDLWDRLKKEKVRANVVRSLKDAGLDTPGKIKGAGIEGLVKLKGIGEPTAKRIIGSVEDLPEPPKAPIEDASAVQAPEEAPAQVPAPPKGPGLMDKVSSFFKGLFGKRAEEGPKEAPAEVAQTPVSIEDQAPEARAAPAAPEGTKPEAPPGQEDQASVGEAAPGAKPGDEEKIGERAASEAPAQAPEEAPAPAPEEKAPQAEGAGSPVDGPKEAPPQTAPVPAVPEPPKQGFFDKIFSMFKKQPAAAQPTAPAAEAPKEAGALPEPSALAAPEGEAKAGPAPQGEAGGTEPARINSISEIPGISPEVARKLIDAGYQDLDELREAVPEDLVLIQGIDLETAQRICSALIGKA